MAQSLPRASAAVLALAQSPWGWRRLSVTLGLLIGLTFVALGLADGTRLIATARELGARPQLLAVFLLTYSAAFSLRALAWRTLLPGAPSAIRLFGFLQIALLANHLFPTKVGEFIRVGLLVRRGISIGPATSSTMLARLLDLLAVLLVAILLSPLPGGRPASLLGLLALPLATISLIGAACLLLASGRALSLTTRLPCRLAALILDTHRAFTATSPSRLLVAFLLIVPSWLLETGALWAVAQAAGVPLSMVQAAGATAFTLAFQGFQVTPGGLGLYEASLTGILALHGVDPTTGLTLAVGAHALKFAYSYIVGIICLLVEALDSIRSDLPRRSRKSVTTLAASSWPTAPSSLRRRANRVKQPIWLRAWAGLGIAPFACLAIQPADWSSARFWLSLLAAAPLMVVERCHHLPGRLPLLLFAIPVIFVTFFGVPSLEAGLIALVLAGLNSLLGGPRAPTALLWPSFLVQVMAIAHGQPFWVGMMGIGTCSLVLLGRQWWLSHRPLPAPDLPPAGSVLAVVVPVHNEASTVGAVVAAVPRAILNDMGFVPRVIVVDDGSQDASAEIARAAGADLIVQHSARRGLGAALRSGLSAAREINAGAAVYLDGDGEYDPSDIPVVLAPILCGKSDYVLGTRLPMAAHVMRPSRRVGNVLFTALLMGLTGRRLLDGQTGFRAFSARALARAEIVHDYNYAQVLTLDLLRKRMRLDQVPIRYRVRSQGTSFIRYGEYVRRVLPAVLREVLRP